MSIRAWLLLLLAVALVSCGRRQDDEFGRLTNAGKNYFDKGEGEKAAAVLQKALALRPTHPDAQLNLANASLLASQPDAALKFATQAAATDASSGAAWYLAGCARLRLGQYTEAVQALQTAKNIDRTINTVSFQLGRAWQGLGSFPEALEQFQEVVQFEPEHAAAHYNLSQVLVRLGRADEAAQELALHQKINAGKPPRFTDPSLFERCVYTAIRAPFRLEQPDPRGVPVTFVDATEAAFGAAAKTFHGPAAVLDPGREGRNSLFVGEGEGFRFLLNSNGTFRPSGPVISGLAGARYSRALAGDLNNDRVEDIVVLGDKASHVFKFATNGTATDITTFSRLVGLTATNGLLTDLNFSRKLDLLAIETGSNGVRALRNLGQPYFVDGATNFNFPPDLSGVRQLTADDWDGDGLLDLFIARERRPPLLLTKVRGGTFTTTNSSADWPAGGVIAVGDLNNDLKTDLVVASGDQLVCVFNGVKERASLPLGAWPITSLTLLDYDNDGWLDLVATGDGVRVWRNTGNTGFQEATPALGLDKLARGLVVEVAAADFDQDGDTDWLLTLAGQRLRLLRNDGGNANQQLKLKLVGTKSNASALGIRLEVNASGLRLARRVSTLPVEVGVGKYTQLDSLTIQWFDFPMNAVDVKIERTPFTLVEIEQQGGSCPYLYAWDGQRFRFVTDVLSAAPLGLPVAEGRLIEADAEELAWIGDEKMFPPRDGNHVLQITEELREVLYLDEAKLVVVDHPAGTEVHSTSKLRPGRPFPPHEIITLHERKPLLRATRSDGADATGLLREVDGSVAAPPQLRVSQLRGLAEPHGFTLDFGALDAERPLVLALTGWLRFGGASANIAASHDPELPFPFPTLEVETAGGAWQPVEVVVGAPAGKTKSIVVDLSGRLPRGARRLRLSEAFEIYWDRIALFEKRAGDDTKIIRVAPTKSDLHWRGFSEYAAGPVSVPSTPVHETTKPTPLWRSTPAGWCTRYGDVRELIERSDNALALLNGGDELTLSFPAEKLPPKPEEVVRDFFLYSAGWDKDADLNVTQGWTVGPLPWHGMDDRLYPRQPRPAFPSDELMTRYNTRWVGPRTVTRKE